MSLDKVQPSLLIASPQMRDPFFERTVVLLWHHDEEGAIGVVVNRPINQVIADVVEIEDEQLGGLARQNGGQVMWGGPVETDAGTVVTRGEIQPDEGWQLDCGVGVTRSQDALHRLLEENAQMILCLGYAGWGPGQLDTEIQAGGWLWTDIDPEIVFNSPTERLYEIALATLGLTPHTVLMTPINE